MLSLISVPLAVYFPCLECSVHTFSKWYSSFDFFLMPLSLWPFQYTPGNLDAPFSVILIHLIHISNTRITLVAFTCGS